MIRSMVERSAEPVTFVVPVCNERETLRPLVEGILEHAGDREVSILAVDDGSTDGSWEELLRLRAEYPRLTALRLRGNFGKSAALAAGFARADTPLVFTMDSDLQDDPREIPRFFEKLDEGHDVVCGWKATRNDPWHKVWPSRLYNGFVARLFGVPLHDVNTGFKLFRREVVKHIRLYGEMHRLLPVQAHLLHFRVTEIPVEHHPRRFGKSKYGFERFVRGAVDVATMWFLVRYRLRPGHFFWKCALVLVFCGVGAGLGGGISVLLACPHAGIAWLVAAGFLALGAVLMAGQGLLAEMVLHHFVRIDPAVYITESEDGIPE
jgi:glycosyltransferase involved in cell wall biosynthesis